jgi:hypothetical protein
MQIPPTTDVEIAKVFQGGLSRCLFQARLLQAHFYSESLWNAEICELLNHQIQGYNQLEVSPK